MKNYLPTAKVTKLEWLRNSPDISPMKNLWNILKKKVADKQPSCASALVSAIKNVLIKEISVDYCQNQLTACRTAYEYESRNDRLWEEDNMSQRGKKSQTVISTIERS